MPKKKSEKIQKKKKKKKKKIVRNFLQKHQKTLFKFVCDAGFGVN
jgi:mannitol-specific phosphotransferase system IIBC component